MKDIYNIKKLYIEGYSIKQISEITNSTEGSIKVYIIRNLKDYKDLHNKNKIKRNNAMKKDKFNKIKNLYIKGYNAKEISDLLGYSYSYMRNYICTNLKEYKDENIKNRKLNKEILKCINKVNNSYMSKESLIKWNLQSYIIDENNLNLKFNEKCGLRPLDLPQFI